MIPTTNNAPYNPQPLIVKLVNVPEVLKEHTGLLVAFKAIIEGIDIRISDTRSTVTLQTYSLPEHSKGGVDLSFYTVPEPEVKSLSIEIPELKDKYITRTLKQICNICFQDQPVVKQEVQNAGFDLLVYELSEDSTEVIDAWKLCNFTVPCGLVSPVVHSKQQPATAPLYNMPLEGMWLTHGDVLREASMLHRFNTTQSAD